VESQNQKEQGQRSNKEKIHTTIVVFVDGSERFSKLCKMECVSFDEFFAKFFNLIVPLEDSRG
jgi:hypothetical protein